MSSRWFNKWSNLMAIRIRIPLHTSEISQRFVTLLKSMEPHMMPLDSGCFFSLRGWPLTSFLRGLITKWEQMVKKILSKYFPHVKTTEEIFKELLMKFLHHHLPNWLQVQTFYDGLNKSTRQMINVVAGRTLNNNTLETTQELIEDLEMNY